MESSAILIVLVAGGLGYWLYTTSQQNKKQRKVMMPKHDVPKVRQRVNEVLNQAQSRHNVSKMFNHNLTGAIKDRYIRPPPLIH